MQDKTSIELFLLWVIVILLLGFTVFVMSGCSSISGKASNERTMNLTGEECKKLSLIMDFDTSEHNKAKKKGQISSGFSTGTTK